MGCGIILRDRLHGHGRGSAKQGGCGQEGQSPCGRYRYKHRDTG